MVAWGVGRSLKPCDAKTRVVTVMVESKRFKDVVRAVVMIDDIDVRDRSNQYQDYYLIKLSL